MKNEIMQASTIASQLITSSSKKRTITHLLKKAGFRSLGKGSWLGFKGNDVISGLMIEGSPTDIYITSFIIPSFDETTFVNWSLGNRIVNCSPSKDAKEEFEGAFSYYKTHLYSVKNSLDLISYINDNKIDGFYATWVKYICYLREQKFDLAQNTILKASDKFPHSSIEEKLALLTSLAHTRDTSCIDETFSSWKNITNTLFGEANFSI